MGDKVYDLEIHFKSKCKKLKNIDPDKYSYIDFIADIRELHGIIDETVFRTACSVADSDVNMDIGNDNDVLSMFCRNANRVVFDVFVELAEEEWEFGDEGMEEFGDESGDEMSDYKSDNHCESKNQSDSELEDDPLKGSLNRDACPLPSETGSKVKLEKGFDGCHLKGPFGGVLLAAIGLDGNNGLFPVAVAVVESECKESWSFFFENLSRMVGGFSVDKPWTFMSDRQKGLVETINEIVPHAINRRCARHIYANFRSQFVGAALKRYFWQAARSYNAAGFNFALHKIKELKPAAYEWLLKIPAELWSRHAFDHRLKNDHVTNNLSESFNHWVGELRSKPILTLVDGLRAKLMCRLQKRKMKGNKWSGILVPNAVKELNNIKEESRKCHLLVAGEHEFEVQDQKTCNCQVWDISGIPCRHATLGINYRREDVESYCDSRFSLDKYMKAYKYSIHPVPDQTFWPLGVDVTHTTLLPPVIKRMPGRPKKSRRKEPGEAPNAVKRSSIVRCKTCNELGHNRRNAQAFSGRDSDLHVPLSQLTRKCRKSKGATEALIGRKRKVAVSQPQVQVSSSQPLPKTKEVPSMHVASSSSQP
ncbi:UNVERIFIED_CONTAM: hypothetical protein Sangu_0982300 [Sesamum angustifolium]|uniref:SWIM-type domain-containing protein n=1 Tax=Sesamum angustifolium TaxID=2727405 RepID=A0AAW2PFV7_9LAMI